jgi:hypothetical protein
MLDNTNLLALRASTVEPSNARSYAMTRQFKTIERTTSTIDNLYNMLLLLFFCLILVPYPLNCGMKKKYYK